MSYFGGTPCLTTYKSSEAFTYDYMPVKPTSTAGTVEMVDADTDITINGIAQTKPTAAGEPVLVAKRGTNAKFICGGTIAPGDSLKLSADSGDDYKLKAFTPSADTTGTPVLRIGVCIKGGDEDDIGECDVTLDFVISD